MQQITAKIVSEKEKILELKSLIKMTYLKKNIYESKSSKFINPPISIKNTQPTVATVKKSDNQNETGITTKL